MAAPDFFGGRGHQRFVAAEVVANRTDVDARLGGDPAQRGLPHSAALHQPEHGLQDASPGDVLGIAPVSHAPKLSQL